MKRPNALRLIFFTACGQMKKISRDHSRLGGVSDHRSYIKKKEEKKKEEASFHRNTKPTFFSLSCSTMKSNNVARIRSMPAIDFKGVEMFCTNCRTMQYAYSLPDCSDHNHKCSYCILPQQMDEKPWNQAKGLSPSEFEVQENQRDELASNMPLDNSDSLEMLPYFCEFAVGVKLDSEELFGQAIGEDKDIRYPFGNHPEDTEPQGMIEYHYAVYRDMQKMDAMVEMKKYQMEQLVNEDIWLNKKAEGFEMSDPEKARASQVARVERVYHRFDDFSCFPTGETLTEVRYVKPKENDVVFDMGREDVLTQSRDEYDRPIWKTMIFGEPKIIKIDAINSRLRKIRERIDHEDDDGYDLIPWTEEKMRETFVKPTWETLEIAGRPWDTPFGSLPDLKNPETNTNGEVQGFSRFQRERTWRIHVFPPEKHMKAIANVEKKKKEIKEGTHATQIFQICCHYLEGEKNVGYWSLYWLNCTKGVNHPAVLKKLGITNGEYLTRLPVRLSLAQWKLFNWFCHTPKSDEQFEKACKQYLVPNIQKEIEVKTS